jgi:hypothetical protein
MFIRENIDGLILTERELEELNKTVYARCNRVREECLESDDAYRDTIRKHHTEVLEALKFIRGKIETNKSEAVKMNLQKLSEFMDTIYKQYPKLDGKIEIISRGSKSLSMRFNQRHDTEKFEPDVCGNEYDHGIYFDVLNLTVEEIQEIINNYRIYMNFGVSDCNKQFHGV